MPSWKKILQSGSAVHVLNITASSLPNVSQPNIIGYDTTSGRFTYFSTSSLVNGGSVIGGSGTTNYITRWSSSTLITTSSIYESGSRIGIGTTSSLAKLHVRGVGITSETEALRVENSNTSASLVVLDDRQTRITSDGAALFVQGAGVFPYTQNIAEFKYAGNGNSIIISQQEGVAGLTTSANANLNISPSGSGSTVFLLGKEVRLNNSNNNGTIALKNTGLTGEARLDFITGSSTIMSISSSGNVGIGTTTPTAELHISGASNDNLLRVSSPTDQNILFVSGSGNVGIGTTSPIAKLQVLDSFTVSASSGQFADVKFRLLTQSYKNHVLTYDETTGQIYYFSSSLEATTPTCNPPDPSITVIGPVLVCSGSPAILVADNLNPPPIGTLTYQWSASGAPILDATTSRYEPIITANTTFTITMCDGVCCNTASVDIYVVPHNTITLSSAAGTDSQIVSASTSITPITYTTTGATGATYIGLPSGVSGSWSPPDTITIGGVPIQTGTFTYTVTMTDGCRGGVNTATGTITVNGGTHQISGSVTYNNTAQTPMTNTLVQLLDSTGRVQFDATTDSTGYYQMNFNLTDIGGPGTYTLKAVPTKPWGGVTATDALSIARHFAGTVPLVGLRLAAADVNGNGAVNSQDALLVQRRFGGTISSFTVGNWRSENLPPLPGGTLAATPTQYNRNIQVICFGDVNGSYQPSIL